MSKKNKEILNLYFNKRLLKNKPIAIFGAGLNGGILKEVLNSIGYEVHSFLVSDGHRNKDVFEGLLVYELSEIKDLSRYNLIYSLQSDNPDIVSQLKNKNKQVLLTNNPEIIEYAFKIYYEEYFKENNINIEREFIEFYGVKFINPFKISDEYVGAFLHEVGDLISPLKNDYNNLCEGPYEYLNVNLKTNDVVIDCGANIGIFSAIAASKGCKCYSFEPVPKVLDYLNITAKIYDGLIEICPYALSDKSTTELINIGGMTSCSLLKENELSILSDKEKIRVNVITLDDFVEENNIEKVDFIKADIEGAERNMLIGAKKTISRFLPKISICTYHLKDDPQVLEEIIKSISDKYIIEHRWKKIYAYVPEEIKIE